MSREKNTSKSWITVFWRRIGAFVVDVIILGIFGYALGLFLESWLVEIGAWGRLLGFFISLLYFGFLNSSVFNGQTIGKVIFEIKVVNSSNETINILKSFLRYCILGIPFFLNGAHLPDQYFFSGFIYIASLIVFGGTSTIVYLYVFNRKTRQSLHDIIAKTYVVNIDTNPNEIQTIWKPHLVITGALLVSSLLIPLYTSNLAQNHPFQELLNARDNVMNIDLVNKADITYSTTIFSKQSEAVSNKISYVTGRIVLNKNEISSNSLAIKIAKIITLNYPEATHKDFLQIVLLYGYDIGISSRWSYRVYRFKPSEFIGATESDNKPPMDKR